MTRKEWDWYIIGCLVFGPPFVAFGAWTDHESWIGITLTGCIFGLATGAFAVLYLLVDRKKMPKTLTPQERTEAAKRQGLL
jgi:hypothetical protein